MDRDVIVRVGLLLKELGTTGKCILSNNYIDTRKQLEDILDNFGGMYTLKEFDDYTLIKLL